MEQDDYQEWNYLSKKLRDNVQLMVDDLLVTDTQLLSKGVEMKVVNSILIQLNKIGTLTETFEAINMAQLVGYSVMVSHCSGGKEYTNIADLAVATCADKIKVESPSRSVSDAKYNRLLSIEEEFNRQYIYSGLAEIYAQERSKS